MHFGFLIEELWDQPAACEAQPESLFGWLEQSFVTVSAFVDTNGRDDNTTRGHSPRVETTREIAADLAALKKVVAPSRLSDLDRLSRSISDTSMYHSVDEASRAQRVWTVLEVLAASAETLAGGSIRLTSTLEIEAFELRVERPFQTLLSDRSARRAEGETTVEPQDRYVAHSEQTPRQELIADVDEGPALYTVWYGTNREPKNPADESLGFLNERDKSGTVHYGTCSVNIPRSHKFGSLGYKLAFLLPKKFWNGPLSIESRTPLGSNDDFLGSIREALEKRNANERSVLVYVHGYNTTFDKAAIRAAQIGYDLKVQGLTAFYSWPSKGQLLGYDADKDRAEASEVQFAQFLEDLAAKTDASRVDLIVHSMGNRLVARSTAHFAAALTKRGIKLGSIILAAADMDVDVFRSLAAVYPSISKNTSMYVSERDRALALAKSLQDSDRAGFTPPITILSGIDTIEATGFDLSLLGHKYYAEAGPVLYDMRSVLDQNHDPSCRLRLEERKSGKETYWAIRP